MRLWNSHQDYSAVLTFWRVGIGCDVLWYPRYIPVLVVLYRYHPDDAEVTRLLRRLFLARGHYFAWSYHSNRAIRFEFQAFEEVHFQRLLKSPDLRTPSVWLNVQSSYL